MATAGSVKDESLLAAIRSELDRRRSILVDCARDAASPIDPFERRRILSFLEQNVAPERPSDVPTLLKQFCVSSFSYAPLRRFLLSFVGEVPSRVNIAVALAKAFDDNRFVDDTTWTPKGLEDLAKAIQGAAGYDLTSKQFRPRIISVLLTGSRKLAIELSEGLESFYSRIELIARPEEMWIFVTDFSGPISQVGPTLICDFLKEMGFTRYVKVDHHFRKEFPKLLRQNIGSPLSPRKSFILSQEIADAVRISPFHLDSLLYLWGRYGTSGCELHAV